MTTLEFTLETLKELRLEYKVVENTLFIYPNSSRMMELLPGTWEEDPETGKIYLSCDIGKEKVITPKYLAGLLSWIAKEI
jgi:hypothetical protein